MARTVTIDLDKALDLLHKRMQRHEGDIAAASRATAGHPVGDSSVRDLAMQFAGETRMAGAFSGIIEAATVKSATK